MQSRARPSKLLVQNITVAKVGQTVRRFSHVLRPRKTLEAPHGVPLIDLPHLSMGSAICVPHVTVLEVPFFSGLQIGQYAHSHDQNYIPLTNFLMQPVSLLCSNVTQPSSKSQRTSPPINLKRNKDYYSSLSRGLVFSRHQLYKCACPETGMY